MNRILLVEDDEALAMGIEFTLNDENYDVTRVASLKSAKDIFNEQKFNIIILDINLPDGSGYDFCKYVRVQSDIPIIFLTACDEEVNIVLGLELGGDDYMTKPFRARELLSRIKALMRRSSQTVLTGTKLVCGELVVDTSTALIKKNDKNIIVTAQEYKLLLIFMNKPQVLISREEILCELTDGVEAFFDENTLSVYVKRVREKIEENPKEPEYIITQRGLGYKWGKAVEKQ